MAPSTNQRAVEARERRAAEAARRKAEEAERLKWEDNDKHVARKTERKAAALEKAQCRLQHKAELRRLAAEEEAAHARNTQKKNTAPPKLTRAQIQQRLLATAEAERKKKEIAAAATAPAASQQLEAQDGGGGRSRQSTHWDDLQAEAHLHMKDEARKARESGVEFITASSIDEALAALSLQEPEVDPHPERRMKAAYKAYEEVWFPRLKSENPTLKRSQLLEMLYKQWRKAPENPLNQAAAAAAAGNGRRCTPATS